MGRRTDFMHDRTANPPSRPAQTRECRGIPMSSKTNSVGESAAEKKPKNGTKAPAIQNVFPKGERFGRIPASALAAMNICLTDRERRLFTYYAAQLSGFAPPGKTVELYTGISPKHISTVRGKLARKGFIHYRKPEKGKPGSIELLWGNIIEKSKMIMMSGIASREFPEAGGRTYPRDRKKQPSFQTAYPSEGDIIDVIPDSKMKPERKIRELFQESHLNAMSRGAEAQPVFDGYYESGAVYTSSHRPRIIVSAPSSLRGR